MRVYTNRTYGVYVDHDGKNYVIAGGKADMLAYFEKVKHDYEYVEFLHWNVKLCGWEIITLSIRV